MKMLRNQIIVSPGAGGARPGTGHVSRVAGPADERSSHGIRVGAIDSVATTQIPNPLSAPAKSFSKAGGNGPLEKAGQSSSANIPPGAGFVCSYCDRVFTTKTGRGVHERARHKTEVFASREVTDKLKRKRWTDEERSVIAEAEARLLRQRVPPGEILGELAKLFPSRTKESLKRARYTEKYKQILKQVSQEEVEQQQSVEGGVSIHQEGRQLENMPGEKRVTGTQARKAKDKVAREKEPQEAGDRRKDPQGEANSDRPLTRQAKKLAKMQEDEKNSDDGNRRCSMVSGDHQEDKDNQLEDSGLSSLVSVVRGIARSDLDQSSEPASKVEHQKEKDSSLTNAWRCTTQREVDNLFRRWLRNKFGREDKKVKKRVVRRKRDLGSCNRATRRRVLRAKWLNAYERDGARTARKVIEGMDLAGIAGYPKGTLQFWRGLYETSHPVDPTFKPTGKTSTALYSEIVRPFTLGEVGAHLKGMRQGAKGPDGVGLEQIRNPKRLPEIVEWFNLFLRSGFFPVVLKRFQTTLIPKVSNPQKPGDFRPISVGSFLRRLFTGILAKRMRIVFTSIEQRGFKPEEGCAIHLHTLKALVHDNIENRKDLSYIFLDVAKAFDSVNHETMLGALSAAGLPSQMVKLVACLYRGNTTVIKGLADHRPLKIKRGVLQGDPLSPLLFNLVMEEVRKNLSPRIHATLGTTPVNALLFADDVVLLAQTTEGLQANVNKFTEGLRRFGLQLNARKCAASHIRHNRKRKRWYVAMKEVILAQDVPVRNLNIGESYKYLGSQVAVGGKSPSCEEDLTVKLDRISRCCLKPQQKLEILTRNLIPSLLYPLEFNVANEGQLVKADRLIRKSVRKWLHLAHDTPIPMYHALVRDGGLGVPSLRTRTKRLRYQRLERLGKLDKQDRILDALRSSEYWSKLAKRSAKEAGEGEVEIKDRNGERKLWAERLYATADGTGLRNHSNGSGYRSRFVTNGLKLSGKEFVSAIRVRCNNLPTLSRQSRGRQVERGRNCPACRNRPETLNHLVQVCSRTDGMRTKRHNTLVSFVTRRLRKNGLAVLSEPHIPVKRTHCKPDIVAYDPKKKKAYIWDPSITSDQFDMDASNKVKIEKYNCREVKDYCVGRFGEIIEYDIRGVIIDWRGAWHTASWQALTNAGVPAMLLEMMSFRTLKASAAMFYNTRRRTDT